MLGLEVLICFEFRFEFFLSFLLGALRLRNRNRLERGFGIEIGWKGLRKWEFGVGSSGFGLKDVRKRKRERKRKRKKKTNVSEDSSTHSKSHSISPLPYSRISVIAPHYSREEL